MSLKYGLNVKKAAPAPARKTILDDDDEDEGPDEEKQPTSGPAVEEITTFGSNTTTSTSSTHKSKTPTSKTKPLPPRLSKDTEDRQDLSTAHAASAHINAAESLDPTLFDYDAFHTAKQSVTDAKKAAARQDAIDRKPKYINNLLDAAARRKQDLQIAKEKQLLRERENEGEEFQGKESFVTGAYKLQQEETRKLEEEEKRKVQEEEERRRRLGGGMQGFYKGVMDQREQQHQEAMEAAERMGEVGEVAREEGLREKSDVEVAAELRAKGVNVHVNEDGQITDKRELLSAGLNVASSGKGNDAKGSDHLRTSSRPSSQSAFQNRNDAGGRQAQRERQSRMMEEQFAAQAKRAREEEEEERERMERAAKSTKTQSDVSDAKARYLARKAAKERGEG